MVLGFLLGDMRLIFLLQSAYMPQALTDVVIDDLYSLPVTEPSFFHMASPGFMVQPPRSQTPPLPNSPSWST